MLVETFECEETKNEEPESSEEAMRLIETLELDGQKLLNGPKPASRFPYRKMDAEEMFVYEILCPTKTSLKRYADGAIPLRVLQVAAHAVDLFDGIEVWHKASPAVKDPVLVGIKENPARTWEKERFILARWGDVLEEWPALVKQAIQVWRSRMRDTMIRAQSECEMKLASIDKIGLDGAMKFELPRFD